eukprot:10941057-Karenia_brevis.AAC.1
MAPPDVLFRVRLHPAWSISDQPVNLRNAFWCLNLCATLGTFRKYLAKRFSRVWCLRAGLCKP